MWQKKLCLGVNATFGLSVEEQIKLFKQVGFEGFFTHWEQGVPVEEWVKCAKENGMIYQSIHAPFGGSADMWGDDEMSAEKALNELLECLAVCEKYQVPIMIVHTYIGFGEHEPPSEKGLERFGKLVETAEKTNVKIAFENTEGEEFLAALMNRFSSSDSVGFCWDSGHEMCYNYSKDLLALYGDKLIATHLNDNLGIKDFNGSIYYTDDLHLLPFDGIADWDYNAQRLKKCNFDGFLTFELCNKSKPGRYDNDIYSKMDIKEYISEAYKRACRIAVKCL